jgi:predicted aminopeptidase
MMFPPTNYRIAILMLLSLTLTGCNPLFVARAALEQANLTLAKRPNAAVLSDETVAEETKRKIRFIGEVKAFAEELGFKKTSSYEHYVELSRLVAAYVLTASKKDSFSPVWWWYPVVGTVYYKGFFEKEDALIAAKEFEKDGLDVHVRGTPAFSTLGYFSDPILSVFIDYNKVRLASLIFHELYHTHCWVSGRPELNESLAQAIGLEATRVFFTGAQEEQALEALIESELQAARALKALRIQLESLYNSKNSYAAKLEERGKVYTKTLDDFPILQTYLGLDEKINNAQLNGLVLYYKELEPLIERIQEESIHEVLKKECKELELSSPRRK